MGAVIMDSNKWKILVTEKVGEAGLDIFRNAPDAELDIKIGLTEEELRTVKFKDILPVFLELIAYAQAEFGTASKN